MSAATEKHAQIALTLVNGIGDVLIRNLISYAGSAQKAFTLPPAKLLKIPNIGVVLANNLHNKTIWTEAEKIIAQAEKDGVQILFYTDKNYPDRLKRNYDAPALMYYKGNADLNATKAVAIVGTRQATEYGKKISAEIVEGLQVHNALIISGLAYGIDIAAHKAALKNDLPTIGVMASGLDIIYPNQHEKTVQAMLEKGGLLTESPFGTGPDAPRFVARNRIIAGMSDVTIVVESAKRGGGLISAEYANNYHREVFAVPGDIRNKFSEGCNNLIRQNKAQIYTNVQDLIDTMNWDLSGKTPEKIPQQLFDDTQFSDEEAQILALLRRNETMQIDEIAWQSQMSMGNLASLLLSLEFQGIVKSLPGKKYGLVYVRE